MIVASLSTAWGSDVVLVLVRLQIVELSAKTEKKAFRDGQDIILQGDSFSAQFWVIYEGSADAYWTDPETDERHHVSCHPLPRDLRVACATTRPNSCTPGLGRRFRAREISVAVQPCLPRV